MPLGGKSLGDSNRATGVCSLSDQAVAHNCISLKIMTVRESEDQVAVASRSSYIVPVHPSTFASMTSSVSENIFTVHARLLIHMINLSSGDHLSFMISSSVMN